MEEPQNNDQPTDINEPENPNSQDLDENLHISKSSCLNDENELQKISENTLPNTLANKNLEQMETKKSVKHQKYSLKELKTMLKDLPRVYMLIFILKRCIRRKNKFIAELKNKVKHSTTKLTHTQTQTDIDIKNEIETPKDDVPLIKTEISKAKTIDINLNSKDIEPPVACGLAKDDIEPPVAWGLTEDEGKEMSIAEQVKEAAQSALSESGMVYVESAGMYYDYKTGYYYNSELGLYYHTDTSCYYTYSHDKQTFEFHSYPDTSKVNMALVNHERRKARKHKQAKEEKQAKKRKKERKKSKKNSKKEKVKEIENGDQKEENGDPKEDDVTMKEEGEIESDTEEKTTKMADKPEITEMKMGETKIEVATNAVNTEMAVETKIAVEVEDGECSETESESDEESCVSTSTASDDDIIVKHHPPCMRLIVKSTSLLKLKVGSLFLVTKDGGTVGREGDHHAFVLRDHNVSRNHLDIKYDQVKRCYVAIDLGSKNGSILNGRRISESQVVSAPVEIAHGSTLELGETKLLCHIHPGNDTCGHCEPGLLMAAEEKEKKTAYTRVCSVKKQHELELARLKNKYAPEPLAIEEGTYNDRAKARRETVGSTHGSEKTEQADLDTSIPEENKGFKLLSKMGWSKGEGLGKDNQGETEPIPLVNNESKAGLGAAGSAAPVTVGAIGSVPLRVFNRKKNLRPPAKLFRDPLEEDDE